MIAIPLTKGTLSTTSHALFARRFPSIVSPQGANKRRRQPLVLGVMLHPGVKASIKHQDLLIRAPFLHQDAEHLFPDEYVLSGSSRAALLAHETMKDQGFLVSTHMYQMRQQVVKLGHRCMVMAFDVAANVVFSF